MIHNLYANRVYANVTLIWYTCTRPVHVYCLMYIARAVLHARKLEISRRILINNFARIT